MTQRFIKNSDNNPLRIDTVDFPAGQAGIALCPGKYDDYARTGPCHRDVGKDLAQIKNWGAKIIVTLMEEDEMALLRVSHLPRTARELNLSWWHFPLPDMHPLEFAPSPVFDPQNDVWSLPAALLRQFMKEGGRVLIHCRGGLGRTGTLVSRLLIEEGYSPEKALVTVRKARAGSVETFDQRDYLERLPARLSQKPDYLALLKAIPQKDQGEPLNLLFNDPAAFDLQKWLRTVKPRIQEDFPDLKLKV
jgi:protein-tyrosine phosphatase